MLRHIGRWQSLQLRTKGKIVSIYDFEKCSNGSPYHLAVKDRSQIEQMLARRAQRVIEQGNCRMPSRAEIKMDALEQAVLEFEIGQRLQVMRPHIEFLTYALRRRRERARHMLLEIA